MIEINTVNSQRFSFNGIEYFKNFLSMVSGNNITIYNAYDFRDIRLPFENYANIILNGVVFNNVADLQSALMPVIYTRDSLGGPIYEGQEFNRFTVDAGFLLGVNNSVIINDDSEWIIRGINYKNESEVFIQINPTAFGKQRIDYIVANQSNLFELITGEEVDENIFVLPPFVPTNKLPYIFVTVKSSGIINTSLPVFDKYIEKDERYFAESSANNQNNITLRGKSSYINFIDTFGTTSVLDYFICPNFSYVGKEYLIKNSQSTDLTITHNPTGTGANRRYFSFPNNENFVLKTGEIIRFVEDTNRILNYVGIISEGSAGDGSETKVTAGTNVTVTGTGTIASPYIINSNGGGSTTLQSVLDAGNIAYFPNAVFEVGVLAGESSRYLSYFSTDQGKQGTFRVDEQGVSISAQTGVQSSSGIGVNDDLGPRMLRRSGFFEAIVSLPTPTANTEYNFPVKPEGTYTIATTSDLGSGGATNLTYTPSPTNGTIVSDTGTDAIIPLATTTNAGLLSPSEKALILQDTLQTILDANPVATSLNAQIALMSGASNNKHMSFSTNNGQIDELRNEAGINIFQSTIGLSLTRGTKNYSISLNDTDGVSLKRIDSVSGATMLFALPNPTQTVTISLPANKLGNQIVAMISDIDTSSALKANIESPNFTGTVGGITATMVGLGNVNNTSDANKPISIAQQTALDLKANLISPSFTGVINTAGQIQFPATQNPSTNVRILDDYLEGVFTPTIIGLTTSGTGTYALQKGTFTKIGRRVFFELYVSWTAHTGTGNIRITGLPYTSANDATSAFSPVNLWHRNFTFTANNTLVGYVLEGAASVGLTQVPVGGGTQTNVALTSSGDIMVSGHYITTN